MHPPPPGALRLHVCLRWQTELNLLKKLHHQNIVEYKETIQSENALCVSSSHTQGATTPC